MTVARKQLRHAFVVVSGATPKTGNPDYWDGSILWATPEDIGDQDDYWLRDTRRKLTRAGYESCGTTIVPRSSIVLTKRAPIGQVALLAKEACSNQGCFLLVPRHDADDTRFYCYWLAAQMEYLQILGRGSTFMELSANEVKSLEIPYPPPAMQRAIADRLDHATVRLDSLIAEKEGVLNLLVERLHAIVAKAVTRGLDLDAPLRPSGVRWLPEIPSDWKTRRIAWLFRERDERGEPDLPLLAVSINTGVSVRQFSDDRIEATASDFNTYKIARRGDVVFNKMRMWQGAVGIAPQDGLVSPDYVVACPTGGLLPRYANLLFRIERFSAECARRSHGIVWDRLRLYWTGFRDIAVPVPSIGIQKSIADHVAEATAKANALVSVANEALVLLRERRAALIAAALSGHVDVKRKP